MKSMTYGVMPSKAAFHTAWKQHIGPGGSPGEGGGVFTYVFRGGDATSARGARVPTEGAFSEKQLYSIVKKLRDRSNRGDENAGFLASSLLYNLGFEWI